MKKIELKKTLEERVRDTEWTDANYVSHRHVYRSRISGSFTMYFGNQAAFQSFLVDLNAARIQEGLHKVGLQVNNKDQFRSNVSAFIEFSPSRQQKIIGEAWFPELKVTVRER